MGDRKPIPRGIPRKQEIRRKGENGQRQCGMLSLSLGVVEAHALENLVKQQATIEINDSPTTAGDFAEVVLGMLKTMERAIERGMMCALLLTVPGPTPGPTPGGSTHSTASAAPGAAAKETAARSQGTAG
jgi:hypothetical protein